MVRVFVFQVDGVLDAEQLLLELEYSPSDKRRRAAFELGRRHEVAERFASRSVSKKLMLGERSLF